MCTAIRFNGCGADSYFARNFDWVSSYGEGILVVPKNYEVKSSFGAYDTVLHPCLGMGVIEEDLPLYFDCSNDKGLSVATLNFKGYAAYELEELDDKTNIGVSEFPFWVASQFESVDEVEVALHDVAIISKNVIERYATNQLHWMIADRRRSIVVEYTKRGMEIFHNNVDVLTNQPGYDWHHENLRNYLHLTDEMPTGASWTNVSLKPFGVGAGMQGMPGGYASADRFVRAAYFNANYPTKETEKENVARAFRELMSVAMIEGAAETKRGENEVTIYTSCFSTYTGNYYYNTYETFEVKHTNLNDFDLDANELILVEA